jgi:hypothetical protein
MCQELPFTIDAKLSFGYAKTVFMAIWHVIQFKKLALKGILIN